MIQISIIVPVYNSEKYIVECIDSILSQSLKSFELILIDDGSVDRSGIICDDYAKKDSRIVVVHTSNKGVSATRNKGIEIARGRYIMFCDADDVVNEHWCECMYKVANLEPFCLIVSDLKQFSKNVEIVDCKRVNTNVRCSSKDYYDLFKEGLTGSVWNKIFRTDIILNNGIRFPIDIPIAEDVKFVCEYMKYCCDGCLHIENSLYYYRNNSSSAMHKYHKDLLRYHLSAFYVRLPYIEDKNIPEYCSCWLSVFIPEFQNIFDKRNIGMKWIDKMCYNHKMLNTEEFRTCLKYADRRKESPLSLWLLNLQSYWMYWLVIKMIKLKNRCVKVFV